MSLMSVLALCVLACSSQVYEFSEDVAATEATHSRGLPRFSDSRSQYAEVINHTKFEKDTFYLTITLEEAQQRGVSIDVYNKWLERLEEYTLKAREIRATGGTFQFINAIGQDGDSVQSLDNKALPKADSIPYK